MNLLKGLEADVVLLFVGKMGRIEEFPKKKYVQDSPAKHPHHRFRDIEVL